MMKKLLINTVYVILIIGMISFPNQQANAKAKKDVFFKENVNYFIKTDIIKEKNKPDYVELQSCKVINLAASKNQLQCSNLFRSTLKEYNSMTDCLQKQSALNTIGDMTAKTLMAVADLGAAVTCIAATSGACIVAIPLLTAATVALFHSDETLSDTEKNQVIYNHYTLVKDVQLDGMNFDEYVRIAKKSIEDSIFSCDLNPELTNGKATDNVLKSVTIDKNRAETIKNQMFLNSIK